jgi:hypothetical protein
VYDNSLSKDGDYSNNTATANGITYNISRNEYRKAMVNFYYAGNATEIPNVNGTPASVINFQQWNLWRVWNSDGNRYYDIEHEEEYLNNYASNLGYGKIQNGMPWGLDGLQLSDTDNAFYIESKIGSDEITDIFSGRKANAYKYDFYISAEESNVIDYTDKDKDGDKKEIIYHPYNGLEFTKKIMAKATTTINEKTQNLYADPLRTLADNAASAVEYCYNKNKRDPNTGTVTTVKWYLPSIDEIEDITKGAYGEFDRVFQKNYYWSSQPAYTQKKWHGTFWILITLNYNGYLYVDNVNYARSTMVEFNTETLDYDPADSGMDNTNITVELGRMLQDTTPTESTDQTKKPTYGDGYDKRDQKNRIRAVYRSGQGTKGSYNK